MTFAFIEQHASTWPVRFMCCVLGVLPSGYYGWRSSPESDRSVSNRRLLDTFSGSMPSPTRAMAHLGCMRPCTTDSRHDLPIAPNLLKQQFSAAKPNTVWLAEPKDRAATSLT